MRLTKLIRYLHQTNHQTCTTFCLQERSRSGNRISVFLAFHLQTGAERCISKLRFSHFSNKVSLKLVRWKWVVLLEVTCFCCMTQLHHCISFRIIPADFAISRCGNFMLPTKTIWNLKWAIWNDLSGGSNISLKFWARMQPDYRSMISVRAIWQIVFASNISSEFLT